MAKKNRSKCRVVCLGGAGSLICIAAALPGSCRGGIDTGGFKYDAEIIIARATEVVGYQEKPIYGPVADIGVEVSRHWEAAKMPKGWGEAHRLLRARERSLVLAMHTELADDLASLMLRDTGWLRDEVAVTSRFVAGGGNLSDMLLREYLREAASGNDNGVTGVLVADGNVLQVVAGTDGWEVRIPKIVADRFGIRWERRGEGRERHDLELPVLSVRNLGSIVACSESYGASWPNDGISQLGLIEAGGRESEAWKAMAESIKDCAISVDAEHSGWAVSCLARAGCIDSEVLTKIISHPWLVERLRASFSGAMAGDVCWESYMATVESRHAQRERLLEKVSEFANRPSWDDTCEAVVGYWLAVTGDVKAIPTKVDWREGVPSDALEAMLDGSNAKMIAHVIRQGHFACDTVTSIHLRGLLDVESKNYLYSVMSGNVAAAMILAESGDPKAASLLFREIEAAMPAACDCLRGEMLECAWRSGWMPRLLEAALVRGGYMLVEARSWIELDEVNDLSSREFGRRLAALLARLAEPRVIWSPIANAWTLTSRPD